MQHKTLKYNILGCAHAKVTEVEFKIVLLSPSSLTSKWHT